ncbi:putative DNA-binding protein [Microaerobacter geothermalis]|uniref:putative DNA-binding protein n=1 Tax=Microaerobacter geothermalis TaxID=674972 RepID=UPI001F3C3387|nr:putative DNA-binding protein [Microaerobacter geothermalis]MCF6094351.1 putative DNA-binding protein [Microaerobacter geothermalis]
MLEKTNRINLLYDYYHPLLTEKQKLFLELYYHDNYSLGEIAEEFEITRQGVYEHIKKAEHVLEEYEDKLKLFAKGQKRQEILKQLQQYLTKHIREKNPAMEWLSQLKELE